MDKIVWILIGIWLAIAIGAGRLYPTVFVPRCPICGEILEGNEDETAPVLNYRGWRARWQTFYCTQCWYFRHLLSIKRQTEIEQF